ncbi:MAG: hypothetical protein IH921_05425, partial [Gemmatimonadetes bacterium]|nr:hypothetical protein [Gemmatimonadota bacterium]
MWADSGAIPRGNARSIRDLNALPRKTLKEYSGSRPQTNTLKMSDTSFPPDEWALILGGSSGFGLASAHKLSEHGLNVCVVHRDRRGAMSRIEPEFERIRDRGVSLVTFNKDALNADVRSEILDGLVEALGADGKVRVVLHSIAFGNLKLIGPEAPANDTARQRLAEELGIDPRQLDHQDVHIHVPAGGIPKDGPSAGVTMFTALASLLSGRQVRGDTAMTGEMSLTGLVLPVGGIKEKVLAAHRAGIRRIILPKSNQKDLKEVPDEVQNEIEFVFVETIDDVLPAAFASSQEEPAREDRISATG